MNVVIDRETKIVGLGLTQSEAMESMSFYVERSGKLTAARLARKKEIHAWLPKPNLLHVKGIGAILYRGNTFLNLRTNREVTVSNKSMSHYLSLFNAFDGYISFEDFTITIADEVNEFLRNVLGVTVKLSEFPYIKPVETLHIKHYHITEMEKVAVIETLDQSIVVSDNGKMKEVEKVIGVDCECLLAYLFASMGFSYDGKTLRRLNV